MKCKICDSSCSLQFQATVLQKYPVAYYLCDRCGFLQTDEPHWLAEAYAHVINMTDTGLLMRNFRFTQITSVLIYCFFDRNARFVDYAGGYGIFTRLMRDIGYDYYWHDPFAENLLARGFEFNSGKGPVELITTFESFEHFSAPREELEKMLALSRNVLFSTEILPTPVPPPDRWVYYGLEHGQHIAFYSLESLRQLASRYGLHFHTNGADLHLFTERDIPPARFKYALKFAHRGLGRLSKRKMVSRRLSDMKLLGGNP